MIKLRRIISSESWVPEIDGLRFVAIFAVLLFHIGGEIMHRGLHTFSLGLPWIEVAIVNGDRGVGLFFIISGFVLARPFYHQFRAQGREIRLPVYFLRRLTRLEPPYLLCLLIYTVAFSVAYPGFFGKLLPHAVASVFYVHNIFYPGTQPQPNFVTWSLEIEVQFYLLAPLIGQLYRLENRAVRRGVFLALTVVGCLVSLHDTLRVTLLNYAGFFPAGFLLADIIEDPTRSRKQNWVWDIVGLSGWIAIFWTPPGLAFRCWLPLLIVPVYFTVFQGVAQRWIFRRTLLTTIGGMCYSIYLMHMLVISTSFRVIKHVVFASNRATFAAEATLLLFTTIVFGIVYFVLIERPCMNKRWPQELLLKMRSIRGGGDTQPPTTQISPN